MSEIMKVDTVQQYNDYFGVETLHPLVSVIEGSKGKPLRFGKKLYNIYAILLKDANCGNLKYGKSIYDYQQGTMLFLAPGQVMGSEDAAPARRMGCCISSRISARYTIGAYNERLFIFFLQCQRSPAPFQTRKTDGYRMYGKNSH